jgi:medium-chain acyl-[acyl-carrier-protein] hydrolase
VTQQGAASSAWVFRLRRPQAPRLRLFCLPYAGGSAAVYRAWPGALPSQIEVCAVRLPGREARLAEPPFTRSADLVAALAEGLAPLLDLPYALLGHSMGAVAAFELARHLRRTQGRLPTRLFVSGARAPERPNPDPPISHLGDAEFVDEVRRRYDAIPGAVLDNPELVQLVLPSLRADFSMFEGYAYQDEPPLECPISVFGGIDDPRVGADDVSAWRPHTASDFSVRMFPGDHFFIHAAEAAVQRAVAEDLAPAEVAGGIGR